MIVLKSDTYTSDTDAQFLELNKIQNYNYSKVYDQSKVNKTIKERYMIDRINLLGVTKSQLVRTHQLFYLHIYKVITLNIKYSLHGYNHINK